MSAPRVRYSEAPTFVLRFPECSACAVDLDHDGDSWLCPKCGTSWSSDAGDGDEGELYADWSGEEFDDEQPTLTHDEGFGAPWIEHVFVKWVTDDGLDMRICRKCYSPAPAHVYGSSS